MTTGDRPAPEPAELRVRLTDELRALLVGELKEQLGEEFRSQIADELRAEVADQVRTELRDSFAEEVRAQLRDELRAEVARELRAELGGQATVSPPEPPVVEEPSIERREVPEEVAPQPEPEAEAEAEAGAEPEPAAETEPEAAAETEPEADGEGKPEPAAEEEAEREPGERADGRERSAATHAATDETPQYAFPPPPMPPVEGRRRRPRETRRDRRAGQRVKRLAERAAETAAANQAIAEGSATGLTTLSGHEALAKSAGGRAPAAQPGSAGERPKGGKRKAEIPPWETHDLEVPPPPRSEVEPAQSRRARRRAKRRAKKAAMAQKPKNWALRITALIGAVLLLTGLSLMSWFAWEYFGTNVVAKHKQAAIVAKWDDGGQSDAVAILRIPRFGKSYKVPIVPGFSADALARGVGWYTKGAEPGQKGNFVIAGHRVTHGEPFADFPHLRTGDRVTIETREAVYVYRLRDNGTDRVVLFTDSWPLLAIPTTNPDVDQGKPSRRMITLITCSELFHTDNRSVVFGELVATHPRTATS